MSTGLPRVLFVDDDPDLLEGVTNILRREPCQLLTASSARKGLKVLSRFPIAVVISDERMPEMSGSEFLSVVCREHPDTVRLMLTGQASFEAAARAINEGQIFRLLSKPLSPPDLIANVRSALMVAASKSVANPAMATEEQRQATLLALERRFPGISSVSRSADGAVLLQCTPSDISALRGSDSLLPPE